MLIDDDNPSAETADQGDLTSESSSGSIHDIIARAIADAEAPSDGEDGPSAEDAEGELSEISDDEADQDENLEDPEQDAQADDESEQEPPAETPAPEQPKTEDPRDLEIQRLKDLVTSSQETVTKLTEVLTQQGLTVAQAKPDARSNKISDTAIRLALYGNPNEEDAWKALPAHERAEATRLAQEHMLRESRYVQDPTARYQDVRPAVLQDVYQLLEPVIKDYYKRQADDAFREAAGAVTDPADKKRLAEIYKTIPGAKANLAEQREALKLAAAQLTIEKQKSELERDRQKVDAKKRQQQAIAQSKNKGTSGGRRSAVGQNKERPRLKPGEDLAAYAERLQSFELGG
jgi:hypothetical protein